MTDKTARLFHDRTGRLRQYFDPKECGRRIAKLRKERGLTQEQLADKLNISTSNLGKLERGLQGLSIDLLVEIRCFFDVSTDYILLGEEIQRQEIVADIDVVIGKLITLKHKV